MGGKYMGNFNFSEMSKYVQAKSCPKSCFLSLFTFLKKTSSSVGSWVSEWLRQKNVLHAAEAVKFEESLSSAISSLMVRPHLELSPSSQQNTLLLTVVSTSDYFQLALWVQWRWKRVSCTCNCHGIYSWAAPNLAFVPYHICFKRTAL